MSGGCYFGVQLLGEGYGALPRAQVYGRECDAGGIEHSVGLPYSTDATSCVPPAANEVMCQSYFAEIMWYNIRKFCGDYIVQFIHQLKDWPHFTWDASKVEARLAEVSFELGKFSGRLGAIGFEVQKEAVCETLATEILNSSQIEGEMLNRDDVRSSVAKRMEIVLSDSKGRITHESDSRAEMLNRLFDGFVGNLTSSKWAKICKVSQDTASREINALVANRILRKEGNGRSTHYVLSD